MGRRKWNMESIMDHATYGSDAFIRFHIDIPIPYDRKGEMNTLLSKKDWSTLKKELRSFSGIEAQIIDQMIDSVAEELAPIY